MIMVDLEKLVKAMCCENDKTFFQFLDIFFILMGMCDRGEKLELFLPKYNLIESFLEACWSVLEPLALKACFKAHESILMRNVYESF